MESSEQQISEDSDSDFENNWFLREVEKDVAEVMVPNQTLNNSKVANMPTPNELKIKVQNIPAFINNQPIK